MASPDGSIIIKTGIDDGGLKSGLDKIKNSVLKLGGIIGAAFGISKLLQFGKEAINLASDLQEVQNVVDTAFGDMAYKIEQFSKTSIQQFGISELTAKKTASTYMAMSVAMGINADQSSNMSLALTGLTADMSSFYNVTQEVADTALKSVFTGETEVLKQFGIVMTQVNLQEFARTQGITKSIQSMTQAEQVQLRYNYVLKQTALAQGDFAKTSDSWANQTRILTETWKQFLGIMGSGLMQVLTPVLKFLNLIVSKLVQLANLLAKTFGWNIQQAAATQSGATSISTAVDNEKALEKATKATNKAIKNQTSGLDEVNVITKETAGSAGDMADGIGASGTGGGDISSPILTPNIDDSGLSKFLSSFMETFGKIKSWFNTNLAPIFNKIWEDLKVNLDNFMTILSKSFSDFSTLAQPIQDYFTNNLTPFIKQTIKTIGTLVNGIFDSFNLVFEDIMNSIIFPFFQGIVINLLPTFTDLGTQLVSALDHAFVQVKKLFDTIWEGVGAPALEQIGIIWIDVTTGIKEAWDKWGNPVFEQLSIAIDKMSDIFTKLWVNILQPAVQKFFQSTDKLWKSKLKPMFETILNFVGTLITSSLKLWNQVVSPFLNFLISTIGPVISAGIKVLVSIFTTAVATISGVLNGLFTVFTGIINFLTGIFTADLNQAWEGIKQIFKGAIDIIMSLITAPLQMLADFFSSIMEFLVSVFSNISIWFSEKFTATMAIVEFIFNDLRNKIVDTFNGVVEFFKSIPINISSSIMQIVNAMVSFVKIDLPAWVENVKMLFGIMKDNIKSIFDKVISNIKEWGLNTWNFLVTEISKWIENIRIWFDTIKNNIKISFDTIILNIKQWALDVWNFIVVEIPRWIENIRIWFSELPVKIKTQLLLALETVKQWGRDLITWATTEIPKFVTKVIDFMKELPKKVVEVGKDFVKGLWDGISSMVGWIGGKIGDFVSDIVSEFEDKLDSKLNKVGSRAIKAEKDRNRDSGSRSSSTIIKGPSGIPKSFNIPMLARGAVIPPNKAFMAVLGDQSRGTNIEAPLSTIVDAFNIAQGSGGLNAQILEVLSQIRDKDTTLKVDGNVLGTTVNNWNSNRGFNVSKGAFSNVY